MSALNPASKVNEVIQYFGAPGLKDLNAFSVVGKKKAELKRSMQALLSKEPIEAHTGLGIIYIYENLKDLSLKEFKLAYEKSNRSVSEAMHYANALFIYGYFETAIPIYTDLIRDNKNNVELFSEVVKRFSDFCFTEELNNILELSYVTKDMPEVPKRDIRDFNKIKKHLNRFDIPVEFYRDIRSSLDKVFFQYFTLPTEVDYVTYFDFDNLSQVIDINVDLCDDFIDLSIKMNDNLQDIMIEIYEQHGIQLGSEQDRITVYFNFV